MTCLTPSRLASQPSTGLSTFSKGFCLSLGLRRGKDYRVNTGACLQGAHSAGEGLGRYMGAEHKVQIIWCGNLAVKEGVFYLEILHRKGDICPRGCSTGVGTMVSSLPGRGNSLYVVGQRQESFFISHPWHLFSFPKDRDKRKEISSICILFANCTLLTQRVIILMIAIYWVIIIWRSWFKCFTCIVSSHSQEPNEIGKL